MARWRSSGWMVVALSLLCAGEASAYEFEVKAQTIGQGTTLRALGLGAHASALHRRRITQSLQLHVWDLAGTRDAFARWNSEPAKGPNVYLASYLRLDQEQGDFGTGQLALDGRVRDVVDVIPELERSSFQLDLLYGYVAAERLLGGVVDVYLGRQMEVQTLDWFHMDGLKVRAHLPGPVQIEAFAGLRVRDNSFGATDAFAPDGTSAAFCEEFVEAEAFGSGSWRPIDGLPMRGNNRFTSDDERCPQREELMPTAGFALASEGLENITARLSYRRTTSGNPGIIGEVDRLDVPDRGFYPFEDDLPDQGINEERMALSIRGNYELRKDVRLHPYVGARYSLLHGIADEAHVGASLRLRDHRLEPEFFYSAPTFDGDSIFNVFSSEPYSDARITWRLAPRDGAWSGYARAWGRRYHSEDAEAAMSDQPLADDEFAGGAQGGVRFRNERGELRLDGFAEGGYGGRRIGGLLAGGLELDREWSIHGRVSLIRFADDSRTSLRGTNAGVQLGARYQINRGIATSLLLEENSNAFDRFAVAAFAVIDLAFQPKT